MLNLGAWDRYTVKMDCKNGNSASVYVILILFSRDPIFEYLLIDSFHKTEL